MRESFPLCYNKNRFDSTTFVIFTVDKEKKKKDDVDDDDYAAAAAADHDDCYD